ncbi:hypothetical protein Y032_0268g790 [Ancylostoma ceylanicum]|uniref:Uncharacterized protein n=1 Tax=Ancylostoma ceylanicum TaxID=53326 RepID=A0A016S9U3_9BILA|nr:hypothetical protein Y032_0268g790 [Ancylostoma ceylanicum]
MHTICLLAFVTIVVVVRADQDRPRVAWVPIESRNISEVVSKALEGSEERLVRIGKMLSVSTWEFLFVYCEVSKLERY